MAIVRPILQTSGSIFRHLVLVPRVAQKPLIPKNFAVLAACSFHSSSYLHNLGAPDVVYKDGLPVFSVPLPSRNELCQFTLKPVQHTVGDFCQFLKEEDGGIDRVVFLNEEGVRIAQSTTIDVLLRSVFQININDTIHTYKPPTLSLDELDSIQNADRLEYEKVKAVIADLYSRLNVDQYQIKQEAELLKDLEDLKQELAPLERMKEDIARAGENRTTILKWTGLGLMGLQFGILARLTWWEYSWDIMEPVTYFITYGTTMAMYAYYVLTRQEYVFPDVKDREFLITFHKKAKKNKLDVSKYNFLKEKIAELEYDIKRVRDPLKKQVPLRDIKN